MPAEPLHRYYDRGAVGTRTGGRAGERPGAPPIRRAGTLLAELAQLKARHSCADDGCRLCHPGLPTRHDPPDTPEAWAGRARMARARQAAGSPLTAGDLEALERG